jgi:hypothetical protein
MTICVSFSLYTCVSSERNKKQVLVVVLVFEVVSMLLVVVS